MKKVLVLLLLIFGSFIVSNFSVLASSSDIEWTEDELAFIENHPIITIGVDPEFIPFEFIDNNGNYQGIAADYLALISKRTKLQFEVVPGLTWPEAFDKTKAGEIDALPAIGKTADREELFLFSEPYYYFKRVIVTHDDDKHISDMDDLDGLTVAVQRNSSHHSYLLDFPNINLSLYDTVEAALTAVATGEEHVYMGNLATANYFIRTHGLVNLRYVSFEAEKQQAIHFACNKNYPELISIFNKAFKSLSEKEKQEINQKWIELDVKIDYRPFIRILLIIGGLILAVFIVSFYWIGRLTNEIAKRKLIQVDLELARQEAVEANEFKSSFLARMSHEIRTPLNAITGMSYLLKKTNLSITQRMYTDRITQASSNMLSIINDILDYSKIEAGKVALENISFSMDQVIQDVVNIVSYKIDEQEIGFKLSKDPLIPNWLFGDAKRITQVLLNVVNNAAKFTNDGEVSLDIRLLAKENDNYHLSFTVKDTGIGMTEEQIQSLFVPFVQADSSITRRFGGSGLGLSIVKNLLDMMGGEIQVYSTPNEGSTFIINITLKVDREKEEIYRKSIAKEHFQKLRILVFDKNASNLNLIESYLNAFGLKCEITTSTESAVNMLVEANNKKNQPYDIIIVDYETPVEGGFAFIQSLQNDSRLTKMPKIIMLLPMLREDLYDKIKDYHINIGIGKPIIPSLLFNGIIDLFKLTDIVSLHAPINDTAISPIRNKTYRVLIAEDNKTNQLIAKSLLAQIGIESILANDGNEAVEMFQKHQSDIALILMDLHMPVMNGYQATELIREISPTVPIVAMTADVVLGVKERCSECGIDHYISKPFDPDQFLLTIKTIILSREKQFEEVLLDTQAGLKNIGGNLEIYKEVLSEYYQENLDTSNQLTKAIEERRFVDARQMIHKVKSSSASIGAKMIYELLSQFQKAIDAQKELELQKYQKTFARRFAQLLEEIHQIIKQQ